MVALQKVSMGHAKVRTEGDTCASMMLWAWRGYWLDAWQELNFASLGHQNEPV